MLHNHVVIKNILYLQTDKKIIIEVNTLKHTIIYLSANYFMALLNQFEI